MFGDEEALKTAYRGVGIAVVCRATRKDRWTVRVLLAHPTTSPRRCDRRTEKRMKSLMTAGAMCSAKPAHERDDMRPIIWSLWLLTFWIVFAGRAEEVSAQE